MKKRIIKLNNSGFTLVELLATVSILAIVVAITLYIAITVIGRSKEKTYDITKNNIVSNSLNYLLERSDELAFDTTLSNIEYKCLTVQNLIDYGYLSNDVTKSQVANDVYVSPQDYIYVERDATTKAIKYNLLISTSAVKPEEASFRNACKVSSMGSNDITMSVSPSGDTWSRSKEVTITYTLKNISDVSTINKYHYGYSSSDASIASLDDVYNNRTVIRKVTAEKELDILGFTYYQGSDGQENYKSKTLHISKIDRVGPVITLKDNPTGYAVDTLTVKLNVTDAGSGVKTGSFTKEDIAVTVGGHAISNITLGTKDANDNYSLTINNSTYTGAIVISIAASKVEDNIGNLNDAKTFNLNATWVKLATRPTVANYCLNPNYSGSSQSFIKAAGTGYSWDGATTGTDAGTYNVKAKLANGYVWDNKTTDDITISCEIKKIDATCPTVTAYSGNYDGNSHTVTVNGGSGGTIKYRTSATGEWTTTKPTRTNAGSTTVYVEVEGDKNHNTKDCGSKTITINKLDATCPTITGYSGVRDGSSHTITVTGGANGTIKYRTSTTGEWTTTKPTRTDAGTTTVYVEIEGATNYNTKDCGNAKITLTAPTPTPTNTPKPNTTTPKPTTASSGGGTAPPAGGGCSGTTHITMDCGDGTTAPATCTDSITEDNYKCPNAYDGRVVKNCTRSCTSSCRNTTAHTFIEVIEYCPDVTPKTTTKKVTTSAPACGSIGNASDCAAAGCTWNYNTGCTSGSTKTTTKKVTTSSGGSSGMSYGNCTQQGANCPGGRYTCSPLPRNEEGNILYILSCTDKPTTAIATTKKTNTTTKKANTTTKTNTTTKKANTTTKGTVSCGSIGSASECAAAGCTWNYNTGCTSGSTKTTTKKPNTTTKKPNTTTAKPNTTTKKPNTTTKKPNTTTKKPNTTTKKPNTTTKKPNTTAKKTTKKTGGCFLTGTLVMTNNGYKEINKLVVGDIVLSYNTETNSNEYQPVTKVFTHKNMSDVLYTLTIDDTAIEVTSLHRFYIKNNKGTSWNAAKNLKVNDYVKYADGTYHKITKITHKRIKETVYNLEVLDNHNYYVYENGILVHNAKART